MQSIPGYYPQGFPPTSPYPSSGSPNTSSVLSSSPAPIIATNLPPMQSQPHSMPATPATEGSKRKQVKNACTNCQKACKKCDDARPCPRCIKYGISDSCINSVRKERKKGIKRGPYKRRQKPGDDSTALVKAENGSSNNVTTSSNSNDTNNPNGNNTSSNNDNSNGNNNNENNFSGALRGAPTAIAYGYPSNLNQYGQPYDPYGSYATYGKDQIIPQSYVMNQVYPQVGYAVLVPATADGTNTQQAYAQLSQQHFTSILTQRSQQQFGQQPSYYPKADTSSPTVSSSESPANTVAATDATSTTTTSPTAKNVAPTATPEEQVITAVAAAVKAPIVKDEVALKKESIQVKQEESTSGGVIEKNNEEKHQPMTPMPGTSNSSGTSSPSDTHEEDDSSTKFSGLTQLCSAALDQNRNSQSADNS